jgi:inorganic pyrophosphatase
MMYRAAGLRLTFGLMTTALLATPMETQAQMSQPSAANQVVDVLIEIPARGQVKYEIDKATGRPRVDRFIAPGLSYPANYGYVPGSCAGDGDPLDALVLTRVALLPGVLIEAQVIGVLRMRDAGDDDAKLIAVPLASMDVIDPSAGAFSGLADIDELPASVRAEIEAFFLAYKRAADGSTPVQLSGFGDATEAAEQVSAALARSDCR